MILWVSFIFIYQFFLSPLPLFNVYAVFQPSKMRGIGKGKPIDTAYKLYREGETLRAIFPGNPTAIRNACKQAPACDYPVVIGNDPYYGGLGGEFAISTSSPTSGSIVLRHELGHNFGRVGEEYDGGGYFGANNSFSATRVKWPQWSTEKVTSAEQQFARYLGWPWQNLTNNPFKINFKSDGIQKSTKIVLSASGIETSDTVSILLDGEPLSFESPNRVDRSFITLDLPPFSEGEHTFEVREAVSDGNNWLSNLSIHEFGHEMHDDPSFIGAFPVFSEDLSIDGYRPTNNSCLMRDMLHPFFCPVCQENNWLQFFSRISLIEDLSGKVEEDQVKVQLTTLKLGQFRTMGTAPQGEQLEIRWFYNGQELPELAGQSTWSKPIKAFPKDTSDAADVRLTKIEAQVKLVSPEIRKMAVTDKRSLML